jgi:hypothetical protein
MSPHELYDPAFCGVWKIVRDLALTGGLERLATAVDALVLLDAGDATGSLEQAKASLQASVRMPVGAQLPLLVAARAQVAIGDAETAQWTLGKALGEAEATGVTLLVPEIHCRLALLIAASDPVEAARQIRAAERAASGHWLAREQCLLLRARAAVRGAAGQARVAAELAAGAAAAATSLRLPIERQAALRERDSYLAAPAAAVAAGQ